MDISLTLINEELEPNEFERVCRQEYKCYGYEHRVWYEIYYRDCVYCGEAKTAKDAAKFIERKVYGVNCMNEFCRKNGLLRGIGADADRGDYTVRLRKAEPSSCVIFDVAGKPI